MVFVQLLCCGCEIVQFGASTVSLVPCMSWHVMTADISLLYRCLADLPRRCWKHCFGPETGRQSGEAQPATKSIRICFWPQSGFLDLIIFDCTEVIHGDTVCNDLCSIGLQVPYICIVELLNVLISESAETCWDHGLRPRLKRGRGCCSSFWHWCHAAVPSSADIQEHHQWLVLFGIPLLDYCNIL